MKVSKTRRPLLKETCRKKLQKVHHEKLELQAANQSVETKSNVTYLGVCLTQSLYNQTEMNNVLEKLKKKPEYIA